MGQQVENSFQRSMQILDLFTEERALIGYRDIVERFGFSKSSTYRYIANLTEAGLIAPVGNGLYSLGPRIIELERLIVLSDPLLASGRRLMPGMADDVPNSALLLCSLWGERVLCIHEVRSSATDGAGVQFVPRRGRGIPYTLFEGAGSIVLLANLPAYRLRSIFRRHQAEISERGLGSDWRSFAQTLRQIRAKGYAVSIDSFHTGRIAVAAPIRDDTGRAAGCLARVADISKDTGPEQIETIADQLATGASAIAEGMSSILAAHSLTTTADPSHHGLFRSAAPLL